MLWLKNRIDINGVLMTTQTPLFSGSIVALVTPMDNHGHIDFETLEKLLSFISILAQMRLFLWGQRVNQPL